jgi:hypothetical protein
MTKIIKIKAEGYGSSGRKLPNKCKALSFDPRNAPPQTTRKTVPEFVVVSNSFENRILKNGWRCGSSGRALAKQV